MRSGITGLQREVFSEVLFGVGQALLVELGTGQRIQRARIVGAQLEGTGEALVRQRKLMHSLCLDTEIREQHGVVRQQRECMLQGEQGEIVLAAVPKLNRGALRGGALSFASGFVLGLIREHRFKLVHRICGAVLLQERLPQVGMGKPRVRVESERLAKHRLGACRLAFL